MPESNKYILGSYTIIVPFVHRHCTCTVADISVPPLPHPCPILHLLLLIPTADPIGVCSLTPSGVEMMDHWFTEEEVMRLLLES